MWGRYLELSQSRNGATQDGVSLDDYKQAALAKLRSGFEQAATASRVSDAAVMAALYLAQAHLSDGQYAEAIALLEDEQRGPLALIAQGHGAATQPQYVMEAYKVALRAYILVSPPQEEKAVDAMKSLEAAVQTRGERAGEASQQLARIYIAMGVALQKQIDDLARSGHGAEATRLTAAFSKFLERIAAQPSELNWPTAAWLAQTYYTLGTSERSGPSVGPASTNQRTTKLATGAARDYLVKARRAYEQLLVATKAPDFAPNENAVLAAKVQLGECYRALGEYQKALDTFSDVLKDKEASLTVQRAAAYTYQQRGQLEDPKWFERAIHGGYALKSTGQNRIWGWLRISQVAARAIRSDEKYRDTFYEARLNIARCRYLAAMKSSGAARAENLSKARQSIQSLAQLSPDLGGETWRGQFQELLKQIQTASKG
jgi:tetratricopeptide (TPR) repeat protein